MFFFPAQLGLLDQICQECTCLIVFGEVGELEGRCLSCFEGRKVTHVVLSKSGEKQTAQQKPLTSNLIVIVLLIIIATHLVYPRISESGNEEVSFLVSLVSHPNTKKHQKYM